MNRIVFITFTTLMLFGCDYFQPKEQPEALARVGESYLFPQDIQGLGVKSLSKEDSTKVVESYIENWVMKQALLQNAGNNLTVEQLAEVDHKVLGYKESLVSHIYENKMLKQRLDTIINDDEINEYYQTHQSDFTIKEPVIKFFRVKSDKPFTSEKTRQISQWINEFIHSGNDADLTEFCSFEAIDCFNDIDSYVPISTFYETFGLAASNNNNISLKTNTLMFYQAKNYYYLYRIIDLKTTGTYPESYVKSQIHKLILRKREQQFLEELRTNIYETAKIKNQIEIYD